MSLKKIRSNEEKKKEEGSKIKTNKQKSKLEHFLKSYGPGSS